MESPPTNISMNVPPIAATSSNAIVFDRAETIGIGVRLYGRNPKIAAKL